MVPTANDHCRSSSISVDPEGRHYLDLTDLKPPRQCDQARLEGQNASGSSEFRSDPVPHDIHGLILSLHRETPRQKRGLVPFSVEIPIRFADVDAAGIVYYPRLLDICHQAFEEMFQQLGPTPYHLWTGDLGLGFPTRELEAEFMAPVMYAEPIQMDVATSDLGRTSVCFHFVGQQAGADGESRVCFEASVTKVCCTIDGMRPIEIPDDVREVLNSIEVPR
jgi:4-hydroxybenzoyl-CoA thioesterase